MQDSSLLSTNSSSVSRGVRWVEDPASLPWLDQPDAAARIPEIATRWHLGQGERQWLEQWLEDGYLIVEDLAPLN